MRQRAVVSPVKRYISPLPSEKKEVRPLNRVVDFNSRSPSVFLLFCFSAYAAMHLYVCI